MGKGNQIGGWAFLIGVLLAVVFGLFSNVGAGFVWVLVLIGLIVAAVSAVIFAIMRRRIGS